MSDQDESRQVFAQEAEELLGDMEDALLLMEEAPDDAEHINRVFRAMHTVKGAAGVFGFLPIVTFAHPVETELDRVRAGERGVDADLVAVLLDCRDHTAKLVEQVLGSENGEPPPELVAEGATLLARLTGTQPDPVGGRAVAPVAAPGTVPDDHWLISLSFGQDALRNGLDPMAFIRYLGNLGTVVDVITLLHDLDGAAAMDPESCYLDFRIAFSSDADKTAIDNVFEFAKDDCDVKIIPPRSRQQAYLALLEELPEAESLKLGELLVTVGAVTRSELETALAEQVRTGADASADAQSPQPIGEILVAQHAAQGEVVAEALKKQHSARERAARESRSIRVDADKLGQLINLVGELVISSAAMTVMANRHGLSDVEEVVSTVEHLVEQIRDNALQLRMVPIGDTFARFRRVVRDVSQDLGKRIELKITGGDSELDKTVVEKMNDPLTHLVRNCLDHGIELPEVRKRQNKSGTGTISLNAYHDSGHIVIEIADDGAGLDPDRILAKAQALGMVSPGQELSRQDIFRLVFEPGLSTKAEASELSGRGVGMDVVKRNIESLRGSVELDSRPGEGTTVTIHLPLTLAIIDGFAVGAEGETYILPLSMVEECVEMGAGDWQLHGDRHYINLRGEVMPYIRLAEFFARRDEPDRSNRESLVVVRFGRVRLGIVVDELFGEQQTVIKPMGRVFQNLTGISGATVLGTGDVALILDVQGLVKLANDGQQAAVRH